MEYVSRVPVLRSESKAKVNEVCRKDLAGQELCCTQSFLYKPVQQSDRGSRLSRLKALIPWLAFLDAQPPLDDSAFQQTLF